MTTITPTPSHPALRTGAPRLRFSGVLRSEWIKLRTLRSTVWSYLLVIVLASLMALLLSLTTVNGEGGATAEGASSVDLLVQSSTMGVVLSQLVVAVLGVLVVSGEYGTGMIRSTLTAVPKRLPALAAKAVVLFVVTFVVGFVSTVGAFGVASAVFAGEGITASLADPAVLLPMLGASLYLGLLAVFSLGVGTMLRSSAGGIAVVVALLLVVPSILQIIPADWVQEMVPYLLSIAGSDMFGSMQTAASELGFWENLLVVLGWVAVSGAGAAALLAKRDA